MILLNFSHPLAPEQLQRIHALTGETVEDVRGEMAYFDPGRDFASQVRNLVDQLGLSPEEWRTCSLLVNPPGFPHATAVLLAEIQGRAGYLPRLLRLRAAPRRGLLQFEVAEIIILEGVRRRARIRQRRATKEEEPPGSPASASP
ncbi:MAG: hypothetical protein EXR62_09415 [Chloroflexi bacterium]|nr:hypothetical protein [Chloroflexota bacterium]